MEHPMDPCHKPTTVNALALSLIPHSTLIVDAAPASTTLRMQDDLLGIPSNTSFDASQSTHVNDSKPAVRFPCSTPHCQC